MATGVIPMSVKATAAAYALDEGARAAINVSAVCRDEGVSRAVFYKYVDRVRREGLDGLEERSRRPRLLPQQTPVEVEDLVVRLRKELDDAGLDHGATSIQWHLGRQGELGKVPSVATIHRILVRRGLVVPEPRKRPKATFRRFEAPAPNEMWQIDHTDWVIATGVVKIFNIVDDHSRVAIRSHAVAEATTEEAWTTFCQGAELWGLPAGTLSDNGLCFSGKLRHVEVFFEAQLRDAGVRPITSRPFHPQTAGKVERFQQTLKKWLRRRRRLATSIDELQADLDHFARIYNTERPHQGIGRATPIDRWRASPVAGAASSSLSHPDWSSKHLQVTVRANGCVRADPFVIHVGVEHQGRPALVIIDKARANVFIDGALIRHLELDHSRAYQPSGRPRGGPRRPRLRS
jgi:transposase InsO family protein/transposase-like protein